MSEAPNKTIEMIDKLCMESADAHARERQARMAMSTAERVRKDADEARMERIATKAMAALIATGNYTSRDRWEVAKAAKAFADAMIVTLEEE